MTLYRVQFSGPREDLVLASIEDVDEWLWDSEYVPEPNVPLWGLEKTIADQGSVMLYVEDDPDTTWAEARIHLREEVNDE